jgi:peptidoglycan/LPS O-acetylase OafA/YrhL
MERRRIDGVDFVKAAAIVAVAFTHAGLGPWSPAYSAWDYWLCAVWVNFQVPAFLAVSGFLYERGRPLAGHEVRARLARVLVPYLVACAVAYGLGLAQAASPGAVLFQLVTGSVLGIYYFIFLLALFIPTTWLLSRLDARRIAALVGALWIIAVATELYAHWRIIDPDRPASLSGLFWLIRSPLNYTYAMFATGWLAAMHAGALERRLLARRGPVLAACAAGIAGYWITAALAPALTPGGLRMLYSGSVIGAIVLLTCGRLAPPLVRFLSTASLGLYLYHHMVQLLVRDALLAWPAPARITATAAAGLGAAALLCRLGTRILGARARLVLGA